MSSPDTEVFPSRLKTARKMRGLTQTQLAANAGMKPAAISFFESGTRKPSFDNLRKLADAMKVTTDYLLGRAEDIEGTANINETLFRSFKELTDEDRLLAHEMIKLIKKQRGSKSGESGKDSKENSS